MEQKSKLAYYPIALKIIKEIERFVYKGDDGEYRSVIKGDEICTDTVKKAAGELIKLIPENADVYERALTVQKEKIDSQARELARMNRVYTRDTKNARIGDVLRFLFSVIINKIKRNVNK